MDQNPIGFCNEWCNSINVPMPAPSFRLVAGGGHACTWQATFTFQGEVVGQAHGSSKKEAKKLAALSWASKILEEETEEEQVNEETEEEVGEDIFEFVEDVQPINDEAEEEAIEDVTEEELAKREAEIEVVDLTS